MTCSYLFLFAAPLSSWWLYFDIQGMKICNRCRMNHCWEMAGSSNGTIFHKCYSHCYADDKNQHCWRICYICDMRGVNKLIQVLGANRVISIIIFITIKNSIAATYFTDRINCQITPGLEFLFGKTFHLEIVHLSLLVLKIICNKFSLVLFPRPCVTKYIFQWSSLTLYISY